MDKIKPLNILLVEDNLKYVKLFHYLLEEDDSLDIEIQHAPTLDHAMKLLDQKRSDLIVLDLFLPDSRGLDSLRSIQKKYPNIPIVFLTALDDAELKRQALQQGAKGYLLKDQIIEHFIPTVRNLLPILS